MEADNIDITGNHDRDNLWKLSQGDDEFQTPTSMSKTTMDVETAVKEIVHAFRAASEREITVGDGLDVWILSSNKNTDDLGQDRHENTEEVRIKTYSKNMMKVEKRFYPLPKH